MSTMTCREAAAVFNMWANGANFKVDREKLKGQSEILKTFGEAPIPAILLEMYELEKGLEKYKKFYGE
jgi:ASC-1-like (ASCH) protein